MPNVSTERLKYINELAMSYSKLNLIEQALFKQSLKNFQKVGINQLSLIKKEK